MNNLILDHNYQFNTNTFQTNSTKNNVNTIIPSFSSTTKNNEYDNMVDNVYDNDTRYTIPDNQLQTEVHTYYNSKKEIDLTKKFKEFKDKCAKRSFNISKSCEIVSKKLPFIKKSDNINTHNYYKFDDYLNVKKNKPFLTKIKMEQFNTDDAMNSLTKSVNEGHQTQREINNEFNTHYYSKHKNIKNNYVKLLQNEISVKKYSLNEDYTDRLNKNDLIRSRINLIKSNSTNNIAISPTMTEKNKSSYGNYLFKSSLMNSQLNSFRSSIILNGLNKYPNLKTNNDTIIIRSNNSPLITTNDQMYIPKMKETVKISNNNVFPNSNYSANKYLTYAKPIADVSSFMEKSSSRKPNYDSDLKRNELILEECDHDIEMNQYYKELSNSLFKKDRIKSNQILKKINKLKIATDQNIDENINQNSEDYKQHYIYTDTKGILLKSNLENDKYYSSNLSIIEEIKSKNKNVDNEKENYIQQSIVNINKNSKIDKFKVEKNNDSKFASILSNEKSISYLNGLYHSEDKVYDNLKYGNNDLILSNLGYDDHKENYNRKRTLISKIVHKYD